MTDLAAAIRKSMEEAAIAGLCREGQVEMAVQALRRLRPDLGNEQLLALVEEEIAGS